MESIERKLLIKKKKLLTHLLNHINSLDEMKVSVDGDKKNTLFLKIQNSFDNAMAQKRKINDFILNLNGLSGRKFRSMLNNLIEIYNTPKYLEIGSWHGSTACSVCYKNTVDITCIDNWSQNFIKEKDPMVEFKKNIKNSLNKSSNLNLINDDLSLIHI